jgi:hypothetical protein
MKNIERITKHCSKLTQIFKYPYFFNWSFPTNHFEDSDDGNMADCQYVIFRVGRYFGKNWTDEDGIEMTSSGGVIIEKSLGFASCNKIINEFLFLNMLLSKDLNHRPIHGYSDVEIFLPELKDEITKYLLREENVGIELII